jgi:HNH endonuclease
MKEIKVAGNNITMIDDEIYEVAIKYSWHKLPTGYIVTALPRVNGKRPHLYLHHLVWDFYYGKETRCKSIDHKNRIKNDNRIENLQLATKAEQEYNKDNAKHSSKYRGVCKSGKRWRLRIKHNKETVVDEYYDCEEDAGKAYNVKAIEIFGERAYQNNIGD